MPTVNIGVIPGRCSNELRTEMPTPNFTLEESDFTWAFTFRKSYNAKNKTKYRIILNFGMYLNIE